ncbi:DUF2628 domain-containing protein [Bacillus sp. FJAT-53711]|uniref:DUF2628 domain-containing protein n=1 Tax=Bacillus yunxiaonensis TaxID=3127665 RepID=A0ABU8FZW7_9BACI
MTALDELVFQQELHKVVRKNTPYYDLKWGKVKNPAKQNTWNWAAFFLNTFWFAYRKMYKPFILFLLIDILWTIPPYLADIPTWTDFIYYLVLSLLSGYMGNRWYYNHVERIIKKCNTISETQQDAYYRTKGGTHIGIMIGLNVLAFAIVYGAEMGLNYLPTQTNITNIVRDSNEGDTLEIYTDHPKWKYIKQEGRHYVVEFSGYDYSKKENVRIEFYVYLDKQLYEWKNIYINGKKLSKKNAEEFEGWIEDNSTY